ncbi:MAG: hypothetical protein M0P49_02495 [Bacilli bacterium]|nr:hypothetical protein [Bacilli bacterium]
MIDREIVNLINNKCVEIHNKCNNTIEEILRKGNGEENTESLVKSIQYTLEDILRVIKR